MSNKALKDLQKWLASMARQEKAYAEWPLAGARYSAYKDVQRKIRSLLKRKK